MQQYVPLYSMRVISHQPIPPLGIQGRHESDKNRRREGGGALFKTSTSVLKLRKGEQILHFINDIQHWRLVIQGLLIIPLII